MTACWSLSIFPIFMSKEKCKCEGIVDGRQSLAQWVSHSYQNRLQYTSIAFKWSAPRLLLNKKYLPKISTKIIQPTWDTGHMAMGPNAVLLLEKYYKIPACVLGYRIKSTLYNWSHQYQFVMPARWRTSIKHPYNYQLLNVN